MDYFAPVSEKLQGKRNMKLKEKKTDIKLEILFGFPKNVICDYHRLKQDVFK